MRTKEMTLAVVVVFALCSDALASSSEKPFPVEITTYANDGGVAIDFDGTGDIPTKCHAFFGKGGTAYFSTFATFGKGHIMTNTISLPDGNSDCIVDRSKSSGYWNGQLQTLCINLFKYSCLDRLNLLSK